MEPEEAARYKAYWDSLAGRAPEKSVPFNIIATYTTEGNIESFTTYDANGNRAFQYEVGEGVRHGQGYHSYDNSGPYAGSGKGPRGEHTQF